MSKGRGVPSLSRSILELYPEPNADYARSIIEAGPPYGGRVDPATVVAVIKAAAEMIASFGKMSSEKKKNKLLAEIVAKLEELKNDIAKLKEEIAKVRQAIAELSKQIEGESDKEARDHLNALIITVIQNYKLWSNTKDPIFLTNADEQRLNISTDINQLIASGFMYAYDIAHAYCHYLNLSFLLGINKELLEQSADHVLKYLRRAINPAEPNSIGYVNAVSGEIVKQLKDWEAKLVRDSFLVAAKGIWRDDELGKGQICIYDYYAVYIGSLGKMVVHADPRNERDCWPFTPPDPNRAIDSENAVFFGLSNNAQFLQLKADLNDKNTLYMRHEEVRARTQALIDSITLVIKLIEDRIPIQIDAED